MYLWYSRWKIWKSYFCRSCIKKKSREILVSVKCSLFRSCPVWEFDKYPSDHLPVGISHFTGEERSDVVSCHQSLRFCPWRCPYLLSGHPNDNPAHTNLTGISFSHKSQNGSVLRSVGLLKFSVKDSTCFFLDDTSCTNWRLKALLVSLENVKTRLGRVLIDFSYFRWKIIYILTLRFQSRWH